MRTAVFPDSGGEFRGVRQFKVSSVFRILWPKPQMKHQAISEIYKIRAWSTALIVVVFGSFEPLFLF